MNVVMRAATSRASIPDFFSAHAVSAIPPAPALANRRVAAWPASVISVLARRPMRVPPPSTETARNRIAWPTKDSASRRRAKASHPRWPSASLDQTSGRSAKAGATTNRPATITALAITSTITCRGEMRPRGSERSAWAIAAISASFRPDGPGSMARPLHLKVWLAPDPQELGAMDERGAASESPTATTLRGSSASPPVLQSRVCGLPESGPAGARAPDRTADPSRCARAGSRPVRGRPRFARRRPQRASAGTGAPYRAPAGVGATRVSDGDRRAGEGPRLGGAPSSARGNRRVGRRRRAARLLRRSQQVAPRDMPTASGLETLVRVAPGRLGRRCRRCRSRSSSTSTARPALAPRAVGGFIGFVGIGVGGRLPRRRHARAPCPSPAPVHHLRCRSSAASCSAVGARFADRPACRSSPTS